MAGRSRIGVDLANVYDGQGRGAKCIATLAWGDEVNVTGKRGKDLAISFSRLRREGGGVRIVEEEAFIRPPSRASGLSLDDVAVDEDGDGNTAGKVLRVDFVDVQQGDGAIIESPSGQTLLIDGGDNQLFARYLAARFQNTTARSPKEIDCIVVTHGDADHFVGLTKIHGSERLKDASKRLFIHPRRVYHNGLVKRPSARDGARVSERELLGPTRTGEQGELVITGLVDDPRDVDEAEMNAPFRQWSGALDAWGKRGKIEVRRLEIGDDNAFDFLSADGVTVRVLGPLTVKTGGKPGLKFLGKPASRIGRAEDDDDAPTSTGLSASHTINGHSVILHLTYGSVSFLLAGDLNEEAEDVLLKEHREALRAEVFKVPHHGSADYSPAFLEAVEPVISVVSSGDEQERKEYVHPRATLMGALGRSARKSVREPLVFVTELAAFFRIEGVASLTNPKAIEARRKRGAPDEFFAFSRAAFGMVKVRTDGQRLLVYTYTGKDDLKEAYAFKVDSGRVTADAIRKV